MWTDIRYFENQFPTWDTALKSSSNNDDEKKQSTLDDITLISSLISTKDNGIDNIYNYTLNNIIKLFNKYTLKYLNTQQEQYAAAPAQNEQVNGTIYVGIHGVSVLFLRILLLIDTNKLTDIHLEEQVKKENDAKNKKFKSINTPQTPDQDSKSNTNSKSVSDKDYILNCDTYHTSNDLLIKFINDLSIGLRCKTINELRRKLLTRIVEYVEFILNPKVKYRTYWDKVITLMLGKPGILSIAIIIFYITKNLKEYNKYVQELINIAGKVIQSTAYELLYGQIGYVSCIQFIQSFIDNSCYNINLGNDGENGGKYMDLLSHPKIIKIMNHTLSVGQQVAVNKNLKDIPMIWEFHNVKYLCSAHGYIGIIHTLLQQRNTLIMQHADLIHRSILYLMSIKYDNGNYPSEYESVSNPRCSHLVQWCHGSPSYVTLFAKYYKIFGVPKENEPMDEGKNDNDNDNDIKEENVNTNINKCIKSMCDGCEHIWKYGLLTKGKSICHGVSGNAYSFLMVYSILNKYPPNEYNIDARKYLYYAFQFASFMTHPQVHFFREPDNPDSLFEGVAGECCFTMDLLFNNTHPKFPCYDY
eukprot:506833_1